MELSIRSSSSDDIGKGGREVGVGSVLEACLGSTLVLWVGYTCLIGTVNLDIDKTA